MLNYWREILKMPVGFRTLGLGEVRPFWSALKTWKMETLKPENVA
jgi:hypothetical protein